MKMKGKCTGTNYLSSFENGLSDIWEIMIWLEEWTGRVKF